MAANTTSAAATHSLFIVTSRRFLTSCQQACHFMSRVGRGVGRRECRALNHRLDRGIVRNAMRDRPSSRTLTSIHKENLNGYRHPVSYTHLTLPTKRIV